jgi:hypothetical protein
MLLTELLTLSLTHSIEPSSFWEAASLSTAQQFPNIVRDSNVHCHVHKSPPLVPILREIHPVYTTVSSLTSILIISSRLCQWLPGGLVPSGFPTQTLYALLLPFTHATCVTLTFHACYMSQFSNYVWRRSYCLSICIAFHGCPMLEVGATGI